MVSTSASQSVGLYWYGVGSNGKGKNRAGVVGEECWGDGDGVLGNGVLGWWWEGVGAVMGGVAEWWGDGRGNHGVGGSQTHCDVMQWWMESTLYRNNNILCSILTQVGTVLSNCFRILPPVRSYLVGRFIDNILPGSISQVSVSSPPQKKKNLKWYRGVLNQRTNVALVSFNTYILHTDSYPWSKSRIPPGNYN